MTQTTRLGKGYKIKFSEFKEHIKYSRALSPEKIKKQELNEKSLFSDKYIVIDEERASGKTTTVCNYLAYCALEKRDQIIVLGSLSINHSISLLNNIKKAIQEFNGSEIGLSSIYKENNKTSIVLTNGSRILVQPVNGLITAGLRLNKLYIDEYTSVNPVDLKEAVKRAIPSCEQIILVSSYV